MSERHPWTREDLAERIEDGADRFTALPPAAKQTELVETSAASSAPDPDGGRNPDVEWLIRFGAG
jgi:hypothetical protein